jgi:MFS family permease
VEEFAKLGDPEKILAFKDHAWRGIFWVSLPPGILFVIGAFMVSESPRWLFRRGKKDAARAALLRSRSDAQAEIELREMEETAAHENSKSGVAAANESLFQRKYVIPFVLACIILACNQATGVNSIIGYNATILIQAGLSDKQAHLGYVILTVVNFLMTIGAIALVDKKGRKFLLSLGSAGVIVSLLAVGFVFKHTEAHRRDTAHDFDEFKSSAQSELRSHSPDQSLVIEINPDANRFAAIQAAKDISSEIWRDHTALNTKVIIYSYGDFRAATRVIRSDETNTSITLDRKSCLPDTKVAAFFKNPFADLDKSRAAPLKIEHIIVTPVPSESTGWLVAILIYCFMASFAVGPGVCVWLALSELMPTRIRSNGMSIALLINIAISTTIAAMFLPTVGQHGYSTMFFIFAGCTVVYFITAFFFLPETKGKTLEEIEEHFEGKNK